jgi:DsbC/DsbD-like thiol-disulfide interchange protein
VLLRLHKAGEEPRYLQLASRTLDALAPWMARAPVGTEALVLATSIYLEQSAEQAPSPAASTRVMVEKHPVKVTAEVPGTPARPGDRVDVRLKIEIAKGWHINSHEPIQDFLIPTSVMVTGALPVSAGSIDYPPGDKAELAGETLSLYTGTVELSIPLTVGLEAAPGVGEVPLRIRFQACDDTTCLPPETLELRVPVQVAAGE